MDTKKQAKKRTAAIARIINALIEGRTISLFDSAEFEVSEMHTCICNIRKKLCKGLIPGYIMRGEWRVDENDIRYKIYWFESVED